MDRAIYSLHICQHWEVFPASPQVFFAPTLAAKQIEIVSHKKIVSHTRITLKFSNLNAHLYNYNLVSSPNCECGNSPETPTHYLLECNKNTQPRAKMFESVEQILSSNNINIGVTLKLLLYGNNKLSYKDNCKIFDCVQSFIRKSDRKP